MEVWAAELLQPSEWTKAAVALLPSSETDRKEREPEEVWRRRIAARAAVRIALGRHTGLDPASLRFRRSSAGKPELAGPAPAEAVQFSVSRSGELCLIAASDAGPIGVDVEAIRPIARLEQIASRFGPRDEAAILRARGAQRLRAFYATWTRREACLKAAGTGLAGGLGAEAEEGWTVIGLDLGKHYAGALAVPRMAPVGPASIAPQQLPMKIPVDQHAHKAPA
jgi:4'-phosphopantetheinyl transferase